MDRAARAPVGRARIVGELTGVNIAHVITGLSVGGAEMMLLKLLAHRRRDDLRHDVLSLRPDGKLGDRLRALGITVHALNMRRGMPSPLDVRRLTRWTRERAPDILQGWMYHGNLAAWWAWRAAGGRCRLLWNIRHSVSDPALEKWMTRRLILLGARLSGRPETILYNSETAAGQHEALGYDAAKRAILPNGFDLDRFKPSAEQRAAARDRHRIPREATVIGIVARHHPMKDIPTFLRAAVIHLRAHPQTHFLLAGRGVEPTNPDFADWRDERMHLIGEQDSVEALMNAMDLFSLSSAWGEAFPNVIGEAMGCGVPCVATDVGDAARIIGDTGRIVPVRDPQALADAWNAVLRADPAERGKAARRRMEQNYRIEDIVRRYEEMYVKHA